MLVGVALIYIMQLFFFAMAIVNSFTGFKLFFSSVEDKPDVGYFFKVSVVYAVISLVLGVVGLGLLQ